MRTRGLTDVTAYPMIAGRRMTKTHCAQAVEPRSRSERRGTMQRLYIVA
jgi:hypothetical protein